jgi:hypothetical protein
MRRPSILTRDRVFFTPNTYYYYNDPREKYDELGK